MRLFRGVSDASVVAVEDQLCVRGFGLSSFCEVILVSSRFCSFAHPCRRCLCVLAEAVSQMVSPRTIGCVILKPHSGLKRCDPASVCFLMVKCVFCEDCIVFLFVVIGFMPRTSCILILLYIVVCRGRGSFVSMWVVHRCASPQMLEVCFISSCFSNVHGSHHERVFHFRVSLFHVSTTECVHVRTFVGDARKVFG